MRSILLLTNTKGTFMTAATSRTARSLLRTIGLLTALLVTLPLVAAGPAPAEAATSPKLKGTNLISGSRAGMVTVTLPRDVRISLTGMGDLVDIEGAGRAAGFVLIGTEPVDGSHPFLSATRVGFCGEVGCSPGKAERAKFGFYEGDYDAETLRLPAGTYHLYVVADGRRVDVRLELPGLPGTARFRPTGAADFEVTEPTVAVHEQALSTVYSNGDAFEMSGNQSFSLNALRIRATAWGGGQIAHCIYDETPPPSPAAFGPGCPAGMNVPVTDAVVTAVPLTRIYATGAARYGAGVLGHGSWYGAAAAVEEADAVGFNLDFDALP